MNKLLLLFLLVGFTCAAQLPAFTVSATSTPQTCLGNGTISFNVSGTNPAALMAYEVFLLPNTTTPVAAVTDAIATNLVAGNYLIVAIQTMGSQSNTSSTNVTIANQVVPLVFNIATVMPVCNSSGSITVNVTAGIPVSYQLLSGPVTTPPQSSNVFNNLPVGVYQVKIFDNCGDASVVNVQLVNAGSNVDMLIAESEEVGLETCTTMLVSNNYFLQTGQFLWPLTFQYTVHPPGGAPAVVVTSVATAGNPEFNQKISGIPYYPTIYSYDLLVTDACGNQFTLNNNVVNGTPVIQLSEVFDPCIPTSFTVDPEDFVISPYTITFLTAPAGFNPIEYNASFPVYEFGSATFEIPGTTLPLGNYVIKITDNCGKEIIKNYSAGPNALGPYLVSFATGCGLGRIGTFHGKPIVTLEIVAAPAGYTETLPQNIMSYVNGSGDYEITDLPAGAYTVRVVDVCGYEYFRNANILSQQPASISYRAGCEAGMGSVRIDMVEDPLTSFTIVSAPASFPFPLPHNVSAAIAPDGLLHINGLPDGDYGALFTSEECTSPRPFNFFVIGYIVTLNEIEIIPNCGSFDIDINYADNALAEAYFLQEFNETTGAWGHPQTGVEYIEGTAPTALNSKPLTNNTLNPNQVYTGHFRIIKSFSSFGYGSTALSVCIDVLHEFDFEEGPQIVNAYSFPCDDGTANVIIEAVGLPPLSYGITTKNELPFMIDNDEVNLFPGLEVAVYNFQVTDVCGNIRNISFDINLLEGFEIQAEEFCEGQPGTLILPSFPFLVYQWYKSDDPTNILSASNVLEISNFSSQDAGLYMVSVVSTTPGSCIDLLLEYSVQESLPANAGLDVTATVCNNGSIINLGDYLAEAHDEGGTWQIINGSAPITGEELSPVNLGAGTYQFSYTVTKCNLADQALISLTLVEAPSIPVVVAPSAVCEGSTVSITVNDIAGATFAWTGPNGFTSTAQNLIISNAMPNASGTYSVTAGINGCLSQPAQVIINVNPLPDFSIAGNLSICNGQTTNLSVAPNNFDGETAQYAWYYDGTLQGELTTQSIVASQTGEYKVAVTANGCTTEQFVNIGDGAPFAVNVSDGCINDEYVLTIINQQELEGYSITWTGPNNFSSSGANAIITGLAAGEYTVAVINNEGCSVNEVVNVLGTLCIIPKGFSPNGDGDNDNFDLSEFDVENLMVFNRFGQEVYEKANYIDEWHGQSDKGDLPTGTYYYVVSLNTGKRATGWVYIHREN